MSDDSNIHESLAALRVDIDTLIPLANNPRRSDVAAIAASLDEFGQVKPIVVRDNGDGTATIMAGNHTVEAARSLGWSQIAAVDISEMDEKQAVSFALADNRVSELGSTDAGMLHEALSYVSDEYSELFEVLGWDAFEMAVMSEQYDQAVVSDVRETGYVPPVLVRDRQEPKPVERPTEKKSEPSHIVAPQEVDERDLITRGSPSVGQGGAKAIVQYTIAFDSAEQQRRWYDFIRWLRSDPGTEGQTTAERLLYFLDAHANF